MIVSVVSYLNYSTQNDNRGGVVFWADSLGAKYIHSRLEAWTKKYGNFFKPSAYLAERAAKGLSLVSIKTYSHTMNFSVSVDHDLIVIMP